MPPFDPRYADVRMPRMPMSGQPPDNPDVPTPLRERVLKIPHILSNPYDYSDEDLQTAIDAGMSDTTDPALRRLAGQRQAAWAAVEAAKKGDPALIYRAMDLMNETKRMCDQYNDMPGKPPAEAPPGMTAEVARMQGLTAPGAPTPDQRSPTELAAAALVAARRAEAEAQWAEARARERKVPRMPVHATIPIPQAAPSPSMEAAVAMTEAAAKAADAAAAMADAAAAEAEGQIPPPPDQPLPQTPTPRTTTTRTTRQPRR